VWPLWDRVVRVIHWYFPVGIAFMWWSGEQGLYEWHSWVGYSLLVAVVTRICWGFVGSESAQFRLFLRGPSAVWNYLRGTPFHGEGHNPLGGWSTLLLLFLVLAQGFTGLFSSDDILFEAPFAYWGGDLSGLLAAWHETNWVILQVFIVVHLLAISFYHFYRGEPLVKAMWFGRAGARAGRSAPRSAWLGLGIAACAAGLLALLIAIAPEAPSYY